MLHDGVQHHSLSGDGTEAGTSIVFSTHNGSSTAHYLTVAGDLLYFVIGLPVGVSHLYATDGTQGGTDLIEYIWDGIGQLRDVSGTLYFSGGHRDKGIELWMTRGTYTSMVMDILPGVYGSAPQGLTNVSGTLYFSADAGYGIGRELWKTGPFSATQLVKDIVPGTGASNPRELTNVSGTLYFLTYDGENHFELWKSDGSDAGTVRVANVRNGVGISPPGNFTNVNGTLYFTTQNENRRIELWKSDGTEAGTVYVSDIGPQATQSYWIDYKTIGGKLFFAAEGGAYGRELFVLDPNAPPSADYNRDHVVDSADYEFWRGHVGETSGAGLQADGNGNNVVDAADYVIWRKILSTATDGGGAGNEATLAANTQAAHSATAVESTVSGRINADQANTYNRTARFEFGFQHATNSRFMNGVDVHRVHTGFITPATSIRSLLLDAEPRIGSASRIDQSGYKLLIDERMLELPTHQVTRSPLQRIDVNVLAHRSPNPNGYFEWFVHPSATFAIYIADVGAR